MLFYLKFGPYFLIFWHIGCHQDAVRRQIDHPHRVVRHAWANHFEGSSYWHLSGLVSVQEGLDAAAALHDLRVRVRLVVVLLLAKDSDYGYL